MKDDYYTKIPWGTVIIIPTGEIKHLSLHFLGETDHSSYSTALLKGYIKTLPKLYPGLGQARKVNSLEDFNKMMEETS